jgi:hypothetical protein
VPAGTSTYTVTGPDRRHRKSTSTATATLTVDGKPVVGYAAPMAFTLDGIGVKFDTVTDNNNGTS